MRIVVLLLLLLAASVGAQPVLLKDIAPGTDTMTPSNPILFARVDATAFFTASGALWRTDGTAAGTKLVSTRAPVAQPVASNGLLFFTPNDLTNGGELWRSDGTPEGTVLVKDIAPGPDASSPTNLVDVGGTLFFFTNPPALWKSDGTAAGTVQVLAGVTGFQQVAVGNELFFVQIYSAGLSTRSRLWKSNGTAAGTVVVKDFTNGFITAGLTNVDGTVFFGVDDEGVTTGNELWKSDGTTAGTVLVKDIAPGTASSNLRRLTDVGGTLFFFANDATHGLELWRSNGTTAGTTIVLDANPGAASAVLGSVPPIVTVNGVAYYAATEGTSGQELWRSDGTASGTSRVADIVPGSGSSSPIPSATVDGKLFFSALVTRQPWVSDGTAAGTTSLASVTTLAPLGGGTTVIPAGTHVVFSADDGIHGAEPWVTDGTPAGTGVLFDVATTAAGSGPVFLGSLGTVQLFAADDDVNGMELWTTDATTGGTSLVKDIRPGPGGSITSFDAVVVGGVLYFAADDGTNGEELWRSDGTTAGTAMLADVEPGPGGSSPREPVDGLDGTIYFSAATTAAGRELWRSDGTTPGTLQVYDIAPGPASSSPNLLRVTFADAVYYFADDGVNGNEPWQTCCGAGTTRLLNDVTTGPTGTSVVESIGNTESTQVWFTTSSDNLFSISGLHVELRASGSNFANLTAYGVSYLLVADYFDPGETGREIFQQFTSVAKFPSPTALAELTPVGTGFDAHTFFFSITSGPDTGLWHADLSVGPFEVVRLPGPTTASALKLVGDDLFFTGTDSIHGAQLWRSDGTAAGTVRLTSVPSFSNPGPYAPIGDALVFPASQASVGREPWAFRNATTCGNGVVDADEGCDDGNIDDADACKNDCTPNVCGDGVVRTGVEDCEDGNTTAGDCCGPTCLFETTGSPCAADIRVCTTDQCDGAGACVHAAGNAGTPCRSVNGACDVAETCTGSSESCPVDSFEPASVTCRAATGTCDTAEHCTGASASCPADVVAVSGTTCRASAGACDVAETCSGTSGVCPTDGKSTAICRAAVSPCDLAETCDGAGNACPADALASSTVVCRGAADSCDMAEQCTGSSASCPPDNHLPDGDGDGLCDAVDVCTDGAAVVGPKLTISHLSTPPGDDKLTWKGEFTLPFPFSPPLDPVGRGMRLVLVSGATTFLDVTVPPGTYDSVTKIGWQQNGAATKWTYRNAAGLQGVQKLGLTSAASPPGKMKLSVKAKDGGYMPPGIPVTAVLVIDVPDAPSGQCAQASFPGPSPACAYNASGSTLRCK